MKDLQRGHTTVDNSPAKTSIIASEVLNIPVGDVGDVVVVQLSHRPLLDQYGSTIGAINSTSLALTTGAFTTEVNRKIDDDLLDGEYWVDYNNSTIRGKKASNTTSGTANYKTLESTVAIEASVNATNTLSDGSDNTVVATVFDMIGSNPQAMAIVDSNGIPIPVDSNKGIPVHTETIDATTSVLQGIVNDVISTDAPITIYSISVKNLTSTDLYLFVKDSDTAFADNESVVGEVLALPPLLVPSGGFNFFSLSDLFGGKTLSTGLVLAISTDPFLFSSYGAPSCAITIQHA